MKKNKQEIWREEKKEEVEKKTERTTKEKIRMWLEKNPRRKAKKKADNKRV
jgi:hypothetical protein